MRQHCQQLLQSLLATTVQVTAAEISLYNVVYRQNKQSKNWASGVGAAGDASVPSTVMGLHVC